jgi:hypothetical protein
MTGPASELEHALARIVGHAERRLEETRRELQKQIDALTGEPSRRTAAEAAESMFVFDLPNWRRE